MKKAKILSFLLALTLVVEGTSIGVAAEEGIITDDIISSDIIFTNDDNEEIPVFSEEATSEIGEDSICGDNSTAHSRDEAVAWALSQEGKSLDYDGAYGAQCVDFICYYYQYLGQTSPGGNAIDYASNALPGGWGRVTSNYQPGDIIVFKANYNDGTYSTGGYGHVAILTNIDSGSNKVVTVDQNGYRNKGWVKSDNKYPMAEVQCAIRPDFGAGPIDAYTVSNSGVTNISSSSARINASLSPMAYVSELGFYLGTSSGNMSKHKEDFSGNVISIWYDLGTGKWTSALSASTTYYYQIYVIIGGKEYKSSVDSFRTGGPISDSSVFVSQGASNISNSGATITATLPNMRYVTECGFYIGKSADGLEKHVESFSGNVLKVWYDLGTGKWTGALDKATTYYYKLYIVADGTTYETPIESFTTTGDKNPPNILKAYITDVTDQGYTVVCEVSDDNGIDRVVFPTWTTGNGQDDIQSDWGSSARAHKTEGNTYYYYVKISDHKNEAGHYATHVYAYDKDGNYTSKGLEVDVPIYVKTVTLNTELEAMEDGDTIQLSATTTPENATSKTVYWSSSDESIATVDDTGLVTAVSEGKAKITAEAIDGGKASAFCYIVVTKAASKTEYVINASAGAGGTISPSGKINVIEGKDKSFEITADEGYTIKDVLVDSKSVGAVSTYKFESVDENHTISAKFSKTSSTPSGGEEDDDDDIQEVDSTIVFNGVINAGVKVSKWVCSDTKLAKVTKKNATSCNVKALGTGDVEIKGTDKQGNVLIVANVAVEKPTIAKQLINSAEDIDINDFIENAGTAEPTSFKSSNKKVIYVDSEGNAEILKNGSSTITVFYGKNKISAKFTIKNPMIRQSSKSLKVGKSFTLSISDKDVNEYTLQSTDDDVIELSDDGVVTALEPGTAYVELVVDDKVFDTCKIIVKN